jgi:WXG100 family type VII secretion target
MAKNILYNVDQMNVQGDSLLQLAENLRTESNKLKTTVDGLAGDWSGKEYDALVEECEQFKAYQDKFVEAVENFGNYIKTVAKEAEESDEAGASRVEGLING